MCGRRLQKKMFFLFEADLLLKVESFPGCPIPVNSVQLD
jgi:hypothetical protein